MLRQLLLWLFAVGAVALVFPSHHQGVCSPKKKLAATREHHAEEAFEAENVLSSVGQRGLVVVTGPAARKLRKKQRRSRSPLLYPAVEPSTGRKCQLRLGPVDRELYGRVGGTVSVVATDEEDGELIVSPFLQRTSGGGRSTKVTRSPLPENARQLKDLKVGDPVRATMIRSLGPDLTLVSVENVYRRCKDEWRPVRAVLRLKDYFEQLPPGSAVNCYVLRPEPNSARLTLTSRPVTKAELQKRKTLRRLRRQYKRGTLRRGAARVATVARVLEAPHKVSYLVDAGGLKAVVKYDDHEGLLAVGDTFWVKILELPTATEPARLRRLTPDELRERAAVVGADDEQQRAAQVGGDEHHNEDTASNFDEVYAFRPTLFDDDDQDEDEGFDE